MSPSNMSQQLVESECARCNTNIENNDDDHLFHLCAECNVNHKLWICHCKCEYEIYGIDNEFPNMECHECGKD